MAGRVRLAAAPERVGPAPRLMTATPTRPPTPVADTDHGPAYAATTSADATTRMSTAPGPAEMPATGTRAAAWVRFCWRRLTSMRTALVLLFLLALAAVPGSLLPQRGVDPARVADFLGRHHVLGPLFDRMRLFDVFAAPWFAAIYLLLLISVVGCIVPRVRAHARALRRPPPRTPARLERLPAYARFSTDRSSAEVLDSTRRLLRRRQWRVASYPTSDATHGSIAAEKGYLRETGNLLFHASLVFLLLGVTAGSVYGYQADRVLIEQRVLPDGQQSASTFTDTLSEFDRWHPGRLVNSASLPPWSMQLNTFTTTYQPDSATAQRYDAQVSFSARPGEAVRRMDITVNHPLRNGDTKIYLINRGLAPVFRIRDRTGRTVFDQAVICAPLVATTLLSHCIVKVPDLTSQQPAGTRRSTTGNDLALDVTLAPTAVLDARAGLFSADPRLTNPDALVAVYTGDLGLDSGRPQSVFGLDQTHLRPAAIKNLILRDPAAAAAALPGGYTLDIPQIGAWASFTAKHDPGKRLVLLASALILAGLLISLRVRRRRLWVRATTHRSHDGTSSTVVEVGGLARTDGEALSRELTRLARQLSSGADKNPRRNPS